MKIKMLDPSQIITLRDYPVRNEQILRIYFMIFSKGQGRIVPPCPVLGRKAVVLIMEKLLNGTKTLPVLKRFLEGNPGAEYFLVDGSHKTTAAALANCKVPSIIIESYSDMAEVRKMVDSGMILGWHKPEKTVVAMAKNLARHHSGAKVFMTAAGKAERMVHDGILPKYMADAYLKSSARPFRRTGRE